jgi:hypothetical protein
MGTLHEDQYTFLFICHPFSLKNEKYSRKSCRENQCGQLTSPPPKKKNCAICEMWKNIVEPDGLETVWHMLDA